MRKNDILVGIGIGVLSLILLQLPVPDPQMLGKTITMGVVFLGLGVYFIIHGFVAS